MNATETALIDFGFRAEEFTGALDIIPVAQFINPVRTSHWGIGIKQSQAELAGFSPDSAWKLVEHEFSDDSIEKMYLCQAPRSIVLNRGGALMSDSTKIINYDAKKKEDGWKPFSYVVVWFLNKDNQPLSKIPFRLKCVGQAGISFIKNYSHHNNQESFTRKFLQVYQQLTGDKTPKNQIFYAHAVYVPKLLKGKAVSKASGQSSPACLTEGFLMPSTDNFIDLIIKNGTPTSDRIKEASEFTHDWVKVNTMILEEEESPTAGTDSDKLDEIPY